MNQLKYYKSMEFYLNIKNNKIPIMSQQEFFPLFGTYQDIDYIIRTSSSILTFKIIFKVPVIDFINEDETKKFIDATLKLSIASGVKCYGYFIGNVKMSDKAYDIFKKEKQQCNNKISLSFCCDADETKLNQKIIKILYSNKLYIYDQGGDCIMIND
jgi:hypothetical protein